LKEAKSLPEETKIPVTPTNGDEKVKIYVLPNLLTAGNLACGFFALTWIFKYEQGGLDFTPVRNAIHLILAAFAFDFFDGNVARIMKKQSQFGREFDSLADIVSFGVAPAFLVYRIILPDFIKTGWMFAAIYLVCGGIRLARFNVLSQINEGKHHGKGEFIGFPIPSGAAMVVSITLFMMWLQQNDIMVPAATPEHPLGPWRYGLPAVMLLVSGLMVSNVRYPAFKQVEWTARKSVAAFATVAVVAMLMVNYFEVTLAAVFFGYMVYGLVRPWISKAWRREIEEDAEEDDAA
jgi:CDP-diacylglycerol---serine O-phosphatidyltransferase